MTDKITRRQYLTRQAMEMGIPPFFAIEAVASVAMANDWDLDEEKTLAEWEAKAKEGES